MKRERVKAAIAHTQTGFVPYNVELTSEELSKIAEYTGIRKENFYDWVGNHIEKASCNIGGSYIREGFFRDEFGVVWDRSGLDKDIGNINEILLKEPDLSGYCFPEPDTAFIQSTMMKLVGNGKDTFKLAKIGLSFYERAWSLRGLENLLMDFILEPAFAEELFDHILDYNLKIIDAAIKFDIDGFYFGDDYGQQTGLMMSPELWRRFIKPGLTAMFDRVKRSGKVVALHSCGNIEALFGDLIDIGLDIYQTFQPEVYDIEQVKMEYGGQLAFWGGVSTQRLLPYANPKELKAEVRKIMAVMSHNGGFIASPTHQVPVDVPAENIVALVEVLQDQND